MLFFLKKMCCIVQIPSKFVYGSTLIISLKEVLDGIGFSYVNKKTLAMGLNPCNMFFSI
jgi:hypothetical protein